MTACASDSFDSIDCGTAGPASGSTASARSTKMRACRVCGLMPAPCQGKRARLRLGGAYKPGIVTGALDGPQHKAPTDGRAPDTW